MLQAFIDDSRSDQDPPFFVLGGYIAPAETWARFSDEWQKVLDMSPRIRYFKYREAVRGEGEFNGISDESRVHKVKTLRRLVEDFDLIEVGVGFRIADHNDGFKILRPDDLNPHYYVFAASRIVNLIYAGLEIHGIKDDRLQVIFDDQVMDKALVLQSWEKAAKLPVAGGPGLKITPQWADDEDVLPLQAADLHATWLRIDAENQLQGRQHEPVPGFSKELRGVTKVFSRAELLMYFRDIGQTIAQLKAEGKL